jgi:hypothetical protein
VPFREFDVRDGAPVGWSGLETFVTDGRVGLRSDLGGAVVVEARHDEVVDLGAVRGSDVHRLALKRGGRWSYLKLSRAEQGPFRIEIETPPHFDDIEAFADDEPWTAARQGEQWGWIRDDGEWAIEPQFANAWQFSEELAAAEAVGADGRIGYVDRQGRWVIPPTLYSCASFQPCGLVEACSGEEADAPWGLMDKAGAWVQPERFDSLHWAADEDAWVTLRDGKCGRLDSCGQELFEPLYDEVTQSPGGSWRVAVGERVGLLSRRGDLLLPVTHVELQWVTRGGDTQRGGSPGEECFVIDHPDGTAEVLSASGMVKVPRWFVSIMPATDLCASRSTLRRDSDEEEALSGLFVVAAAGGASDSPDSEARSWQFGLWSVPNGGLVLPCEFLKLGFFKHPVTDEMMVVSSRCVPNRDGPRQGVNNQDRPWDELWYLDGRRFASGAYHQWSDMAPTVMVNHGVYLVDSALRDAWQVRAEPLVLTRSDDGRQVVLHSDGREEPIESHWGRCAGMGDVRAAWRLALRLLAQAKAMAGAEFTDEAIVEQKTTAARAYLLQAFEHGAQGLGDDFPAVCLTLGSMLLRREGGPIDEVAARKIFEMGYRGNHRCSAQIQINLAAMYEQGRGGPVLSARAGELRLKALGKTADEAFQTARCLTDGTQCETDFARAAAACRISVERGRSDALLELARVHWMWGTQIAETPREADPRSGREPSVLQQLLRKAGWLLLGRCLPKHDSEATLSEALLHFREARSAYRELLQRPDITTEDQRFAWTCLAQLMLWKLSAESSSEEIVSLLISAAHAGHEDARVTLIEEIYPPGGFAPDAEEFEHWSALPPT